MKSEQFVAKSYQLILTTADIACQLQAWEEPPAEQVSKFSFYFIDSAEMGAGPKVVRHAVRGWGPQQRQALLAAAEDHAVSAKGAITAVVRSYGDQFSEAVRIDAHYGKSKFSVEFPYRRNETGFEYVTPLSEMQGPLGAALTEWASQAVRKKILGLF